MTKKLKPYTIIPSDLYVHREADTQLESIIEDMGRPGYVLVARQMGKTNLLLNTKRELECSNDIFIYIDLSNSFGSAQDCFDNIIDIILDVYGERLSEAYDAVCEYRKKQKDSTIPPHKRHLNELRIILKAITGKLVIILDEIDALTKTDYSDQVFSQIRSIYFTRPNYEEFNRLTYILSGVIEPREIIKDPNISPFNIGQKIFLNDFTKSEFTTFLSQSQLNLTDKIKEYIFHWTNGNPRITWDVCSEIENLGSIRELKKEDVDNVIKKNYLTTFDKPPIDTIRELVKNDPELRNSIVEIEYRKGQAVSDKTKSKLYLSGIINHHNGKIEIKNEVIRQALNLNWINELEKEDKDLLQLATEYFEKSDFKKALELYNDYLLHNYFEEDKQSYYYFQMGFCSLNLLSFSQSLEYFENAKFDKHEDEAKQYYITQNYKGMAHYYMGQYKEAIEYFKSVFQRTIKDSLYSRAVINYVSVKIKFEGEDCYPEVKKFLNGIINEEAIDVTKIKQDELNELKASAHYNLAQILAEQDEVIDNYKIAIEYAPKRSLPEFILGLYSVLEDENEGEIDLIVKKMVELICDEEVKPEEFNSDYPTYYNFDHLKKMLLIVFLKNRGLFDEKLKGYLNCFKESSYGKQLFDLAVFSIKQDRSSQTAKIIFKEILENRNIKSYEVDEKTYYDALKVYLYSSSPENDYNKYMEFLELFKNREHKIIDSVDITVFAFLIHYFSQNEEYKKALNTIFLINRFQSIAHDEHWIDYLVFDNFEMTIYGFQKQKAKAFKKANEIIKIINKRKDEGQKSSLLGETGLKTIEESAIRIFNRSKVYGRNEYITIRYENGTIKTIKYKKAQSDIESGLCEVIPTD